MLENVFAKGERNFEKVNDRIINGKNYHLYKVVMHKGKYNENTTYELFMQKIGKKHRFDKHEEYSHVELYPNDESFGSWAFSFNKLEQVDRYIQQYLEK